MIEIVFGKSAQGTMKYMGIAPADLYCFNLGLSMGDLKEKTYPDLTELKTRLVQGEPARLWYSEKSPEEACGFHWLLAQLKELETAELYAAVLPAYFPQPDGCTVTCNDWGSVVPEDWMPFLEEKTPLRPSQRIGASLHWQELEEENAPLRAIINGSLVSVPADFYDHFLLRELERQDDLFMEAKLIGKVMGSYQLGIGDELLHHRIETFIESGFLEITSSTEEAPLRRLLRKTRK